MIYYILTENFAKGKYKPKNETAWTAMAANSEDPGLKRDQSV